MGVKDSIQFALPHSLKSGCYLRCVLDTRASSARLRRHVGSAATPLLRALDELHISNRVLNAEDRERVRELALPYRRSRESWQ